MGTKIEQGTFAILDRLYRVAKDETYGSWGEIYNDVAKLVGAGPGGMTIFHTRNGSFKSDNSDLSVIASNLDPAAIDEYKQYYQHVSPFRRKIASLRAGETFSRRVECPDGDYEKTEFYNDYLRKYGIYEYEYHALFTDRKLTGGINFSRPKSRPEFSKSERQALDILVPHIARAFELQQNFISTFKKDLCMVDILNRLEHGVLIVDSSAKIIHANTAAEIMLLTADGLETHDKTLNAAFPSDNQLLKRLIRVIFSEDISDKGLACLDMLVSRPSGSRPLHVTLFHFSHEEFANSEGGELAIIFIQDLASGQHTSENILISTYGLTPSEARLSSLLADGCSVGEASEILNIQPNTVRTHLKNIYSKTDTNRQSELIRLILKGPGTLVRHPV